MQPISIGISIEVGEAEKTGIDIKITRQNIPNCLGYREKAFKG